MFKHLCIYPFILLLVLYFFVFIKISRSALNSLSSHLHSLCLGLICSASVSLMYSSHLYIHRSSKSSSFFRKLTASKHYGHGAQLSFPKQNINNRQVKAGHQRTMSTGNKNPRTREGPTLIKSIGYPSLESFKYAQNSY